MNTENKLNDNVAEIREIITSEMRKVLQELQRARYTKVRKRKNQRVVYLPKDPVVQGVLERLQGSPDEPLHITVKKVFEVAAKHLNLR